MLFTIFTILAGFSAGVLLTFLATAGLIALSGWLD